MSKKQARKPIPDDLNILNNLLHCLQISIDDSFTCGRNMTVSMSQKEICSELMDVLPEMDKEYNLYASDLMRILAQILHSEKPLTDIIGFSLAFEMVQREIKKYTPTKRGKKRNPKASQQVIDTVLDILKEDLAADHRLELDQRRLMVLVNEQGSNLSDPSTVGHAVIDLRNEGYDIANRPYRLKSLQKKRKKKPR